MHRRMSDNDVGSSNDSELRAKGREFMVTAAAMAVALALSVTFREALASSQLSVPLLIKVTWLAFALCVVCAIAERFMSSMRFTIHAVGSEHAVEGGAVVARATASAGTLRVRPRYRGAGRVRMA